MKEMNEKAIEKLLKKGFIKEANAEGLNLSPEYPVKLAFSRGEKVYFHFGHYYEVLHKTVMIDYEKITFLTTLTTQSQFVTTN